MLRRNRATYRNVGNLSAWAKVVRYTPMMRFLSARPAIAALALLLGTVALAQTPSAPAKTETSKPEAPLDTLFMSAGVGSFKLLPPGPDKTKGTLDMNFEGTVMVSGLTGNVTIGPGVRLEYERKDHNRRVYFGKGHIRVEGEYRAIQFFGRNLKGSFKGVTVARLYGEFDKNMETGYYWYASNPEKIDWGSYGRTLTVPPFKDPNANAPKGKVRDLPKKGV